MVTKEKLEKDLIALNQQIEQSAANHNVIIGARAQLQKLIADIFESEINAGKQSEGDENAA